MAKKKRERERENRQNQLRDSLQKHLISSLQKCQGHKNRERLRDCHRLKDTKETWELNARSYPESGPGTKKEH